MLSVKQGSIKYHSWVFGMTRPGIEPRSPGSLVNTLPIRPMGQFICTTFIGSNIVIITLRTSDYTSYALKLLKVSLWSYQVRLSVCLSLSLSVCLSLSIYISTNVTMIIKMYIYKWIFIRHNQRLWQLLLFFSKRIALSPDSTRCRMHPLQIDNVTYQWYGYVK